MDGVFCECEHSTEGAFGVDDCTVPIWIGRLAICNGFLRPVKMKTMPCQKLCGSARIKLPMPVRYLYTSLSVDRSGEIVAKRAKICKEIEYNKEYWKQKKL